MKTNSCCDCDPRTCAVALGRWCLGVLLFFVGSQKLQNPAGFANTFIVTPFQTTWLPIWILKPFGYALPFIETTLGVLLVLGILRNPTLFATGLLFIVLMFGQVIMKQHQVVSQNALYLFMTAAVLFLGEYDRWILKPPAAKSPSGSGQSCQEY